MELSNVGKQLSEHLEDTRRIIKILTDETLDIRDRIREAKSILSKMGDPPLRAKALNILSLLLAIYKPEKYPIWSRRKVSYIKEKLKFLQEIKTKSRCTLS